MGYGNVSSTGQFRNICLQEQILAKRKLRTQRERIEAPRYDLYDISNVVHRISSDKTNIYCGVFEAIRNCGDNDTVIVYPGVYCEDNPGAEWLMHDKTNVTIIGKGNPQIVVRADKPGYQISMQLPYNTDLRMEGIQVKTIL